MDMKRVIVVLDGVMSGTGYNQNTKFTPTLHPYTKIQIISWVTLFGLGKVTFIQVGKAFRQSVNH